MSPGEMTGGSGARSFVGELLPGGLNGLFVGESGRDPAGVEGRESLTLEAGISGGAMIPSLLNVLALLGAGEGEGESCDKVSMVLSDKEGRGRRFSVLAAVGFSLPSSNTGASEFGPGGVVSMVVDLASRRASLTGDSLLGLVGLSVQPYRDRMD